MFLGMVLVILGPIIEALQRLDWMALGAPPWVSAMVMLLGVVVMALRNATTQPLEAKEARRARRRARPDRLPLGILLALMLAWLMASCGPRLCKVVELIPDGKGGVSVNCDGEPWGIGAKFEDQRKCKDAPDGR
jgi:drug/metabolite transporter (DMT)-like permease